MTPAMNFVALPNSLLASQSTFRGTLPLSIPTTKCRAMTSAIQPSKTYCAPSTSVAMRACVISTPAIFRAWSKNGKTRAARNVAKSSSAGTATILPIIASLRKVAACAAPNRFPAAGPLHSMARLPLALSSHTSPTVCLQSQVDSSAGEKQEKCGTAAIGPASAKRGSTGDVLNFGTAKTRLDAPRFASFEACESLLHGPQDDFAFCSSDPSDSLFPARLSDAPSCLRSHLRFQ